MDQQQYSDGLIVAPSENTHKEVVSGPQTPAPSYGAVPYQIQGPPAGTRWPRSAIWTVAGLAALLVAAAVGGGVGGSIAVKNAKNSCTGTSADSGEANACPAAATVTVSVDGSATSTLATSTSTATTATIPPTEDLPLDCPDIHNDEQAIDLGSRGTWTFSIKCGVDIVGNAPDIIALTAYSLEDCIRSCASMNYYARVGQTADEVDGTGNCLAVRYVRDWTGNVEPNLGNCWIKNTTSSMVDTGDNDGAVAVLL